MTRTSSARPPDGYDPSAYPAFAVTVDVVILTMAAGALSVLLVRRGEEPYQGQLALPGGFKRPDETLDQAAQRELQEETGVDAASLLRQFGAYGDPGRDPRMNVVTVGYLAVVRDVGTLQAGTDATEAVLTPVAPLLKRPGRRRAARPALAFDHDRILVDAVERLRIELEVGGVATAFVGSRFTLAELRGVYESVWGVELDAANFRRSLVTEPGWVVATGRRAAPGPAGGRPAELYRAGEAWRSGTPLHRTPRTPTTPRTRREDPTS